MLETTTVNGIATPYLQCGPVDADEAVVFVHGNPGPKDDWEVLMRGLDEKLRGLAPDLPGFGDSGRPRNFAYTIAGYADHLAKFIDQMGITRVHLVLHDFGGPWGLGWAAEHKSQLASVTLINAGVLFGFEWHKFAKIWQVPLLGELFQLSTTKFSLRQFLNNDNPKPFPEVFIDRVHRHSDWGQKRAVLKLYRACKDAAALAEALADSLGVVDCPTLVVWGKDDVYIPPRYAEAQTKVFPRAKVHVLDGCGHWPFVDDPERVAKLVIPLLNAAAGR